MSSVATKKKRPVYLNLVQIRLPLPALVSILHRVSGSLMFVAGVWLLYLLDRSLTSEEGFASVRHYAAHPLVKGVLLVLVWAYSHHFFAGIRYLLLDLDKGTDLAPARMTSWVVLGASLVTTLFLGAKIW
ncbi:MAG: succinate dehydrogenase, cytochrome b556 subunit [Betaproteobacteria bacterium]